jgi:hypothetical protein
MSNPRDPIKLKKNIRSLFSLGFILALLAGIGGASLFILGWYRAPNVVQPLWKFGQWMMLSGIINLFVYLCLFFQVRRLMKPNENNP